MLIKKNFWRWIFVEKGHDLNSLEQKYNYLFILFTELTGGYNKLVNFRR